MGKHDFLTRGLKQGENRLVRKSGKKCCVFGLFWGGKKGDFLTRASTPPQKVSRENFLSFQKFQKLACNSFNYIELSAFFDKNKIFSRETLIFHSNSRFADAFSVQSISQRTIFRDAEPQYFGTSEMQNLRTQVPKFSSLSSLNTEVPKCWGAEVLKFPPLTIS